MGGTHSVCHGVASCFSVFLLVPVLVIISKKLSLFVDAVLGRVSSFILLTPIVGFVVQLVPFILA